MLGRAPELRLFSEAAHVCAGTARQQLCTRTAKRYLDVYASKSKRNIAKAPSPKSRTPSQQATNLPAPPPRIDSNSNIPVRQQQKLVKARKAYEAAANRKPRKQTFRKTKLDPEQRAEEARKHAEAEQAAQIAFKKSPLASLQNLYGVKGNEHPPVLLVDGYNVLHKYTDFMREAQPSHDVVAAHFEEQRSLLEATLISYSQKHGIKVVIAYDAINRPPDPVYVDIRTSTRETLHGAIDVVFCSDQSADLWLVKELDVLKQEGKVPHVLVATDDNEVISSTRSGGGFAIPCLLLIDEILKAEQDVLQLSSGHVSRDPDVLLAQFRARGYKRPFKYEIGESSFEGFSDFRSLVCAGWTADVLCNKLI